jgi:tetratricopeptide (TPR) repeat protein
MEQLQYAVSLVEQGKVEEGMAQLEKISAGCDDQTKYDIALLYYEWGIMDKTKDLVEQLFLNYPDEAELQIFMAEVLVELGEEDEAIDYLLEIDSENESFPRALLLLADLYQAQGLEEVAEQKIKEAKRLKPNEPVITLALAEFYLSHGHVKKSIPLYESLLEFKKELSSYHVPLKLAEAYSSSGMWQEALPYYEEGLEDYTDFDALNRYGFTLFKLEKYERAIEIYEKLKSLDYEYATVYLQLSSAYEAVGNDAQALEQLKQGMKVDEFNPELFTKAGVLALKLKEEATAEDYLRNALVLDPADHNAVEALCALFRRQERPEDVIELLSSLHELGEDNQAFEWELASAQNKLENYSEALKHYEIAYNVFNNNLEFLEEFGQFLVEEGNLTKAIDIYKEATKLPVDTSHIEERIQELTERLQAW